VDSKAELKRVYHKGKPDTTLYGFRKEFHCFVPQVDRDCRLLLAYHWKKVLLEVQGFYMLETE